MCSVSKVNDMLKLTQSSRPGTTPELSAVKLKHNRDGFFLIDIREADEISSDPLDTTVADAEVPMGRIFCLSTTDAFEEWKNNGKKIVLLCNTGYRASLAASELAANGMNAMVLSRGIIGLRNPAATVPDLVVLLSTKNNAEKISLALTACAVAASNDETVVLVLMGDGVSVFLRKGNNKEEESEASFRVEGTFLGEPFKPCKSLLNKFVGSGNGVVLGCTSCVKHRGFDFGSDLLDVVQPMQMPDFLRMQGEAKKTLQFM
mmetsp:Transcript_25199/g.37093  ORF Transcript_25199/g.37093 Transcript_25199/m.37093 type:complete len:261 (+) Transcript_25199:130-912(+)|eukprot:CAMPEP_0195524672 /NCGR_PEP_ID=MMETSP0794_2-20130614/24635_1 /TAXON_ID=515487 /ORGANISM="Stephanopyxis turris, Strain CCMP 815" /LENGTH=260 /DNA_ID=CAMNT_0040654939 /DNA_START=113 /DNA_END=895 /DNA_ORIENTATION=+